MAALRGGGHHGAVRVLVVEDEEALADAIARGLRREGMAVDVAGDGGVALEKAATNGYDVVVLDPARHYVIRAGRPLPVTRKELAVLEVLIRAGGAVVSPEQLLERVWDEHADPFTNTIRVTVMNLRRKLGDPPVIETVVGSGYRIVTS